MSNSNATVATYFTEYDHDYVCLLLASLLSATCTELVKIVNESIRLTRFN